MYYLHTFPNAYIRYYTNDMILHIDSNAAYLVATKSHSIVAGYFHPSDHPTITKHPKLNDAIFVQCKTLRDVLFSSSKKKVAGIFNNERLGIPIRNILHALHHPQPPTPIKTDSYTATGFKHDNIHQKSSKSWDMRYYWLRDHQTQKQFHFHWDKGTNNDADYFTKHHATKFHILMINSYVQELVVFFIQRQTLTSFTTPSVSQGCVAPPMTSH